MTESKRVIVCGGRKYTNRDTIATWMMCHGVMRDSGITVVHGDARGADSIAAAIAIEWGLTVDPHRADWARHGSPAAAHIRNQEMVDLGADVVLAFPGGTGTADCVRRAKKAGIPVSKCDPSGITRRLRAPSASSDSTEIERLRHGLLACAREAGEDVSEGIPTWPDIVDWAVAAVKTGRTEYDQETLEIEEQCKELRVEVDRLTTASKPTKENADG